MPPRSPEPQIALGRAIRIRREELGLSQQALALEAGLEPTFISHVESGHQNPSWGKVDRIARALDLAVWQLGKRSDALETSDRRPTHKPLPPPVRSSRSTRKHKPTSQSDGA